MACSEDDASIADAEDLWRRVHPRQVVPDDNLGRVRPSSAAFKDYELSCLRAREDTPERALAAIAADGLSWGKKGFSLAALAAGLARRLKQAVCRDPTPEDPAHVLVVGKKKSGRVSGTFAEEARWVGAAPTLPQRLDEPGD